MQTRRRSSRSDKTVINMTTSLIIALLLCIIKFKWRRHRHNTHTAPWLAPVSSIRARDHWPRHWPWNFRKQQKKVRCFPLFSKSIESTDPFIFELNTFLEKTITIFSKMRHFCIPYVNYWDWEADDTRQQDSRTAMAVSSCELTISVIFSFLGDLSLPLLSHTEWGSQMFPVDNCACWIIRFWGCLLAV